jgi:deazaflavin-dependent oxidoreductase (nitroreductase family)
VLLLTTTGRRSGQQRTAPVVYLAHGQQIVVIGSNADHARAPAWSLNLQANPDAQIELGASRRQVRARVAEGDERANLWHKVNEMYEGFDSYDANTSREIAVFVLEPR